jgi:hypothetical protein
MKQTLLLLAVAATVLVCGMVQLSRPAMAQLSCVTVCHCSAVNYCAPGKNKLCSGSCENHGYQNCCTWCQTACSD